MCITNKYFKNKKTLHNIFWAEYTDVLCRSEQFKYSDKYHLYLDRLPGVSEYILHCILNGINIDVKLINKHMTSKDINMSKIHASIKALFKFLGISYFTYDKLGKYIDKNDRRSKDIRYYSCSMEIRNKPKK